MKHVTHMGHLREFGKLRQKYNFDNLDISDLFNIWYIWQSWTVSTLLAWEDFCLFQELLWFQIQITKGKQWKVLLSPEFPFWSGFQNFHLWVWATNFPAGAVPDMRMQFTKTGDIAFPRAYNLTSDSTRKRNATLSYHTWQWEKSFWTHRCSFSWSLCDFFTTGRQAWNW